MFPGGHAFGQRLSSAFINQLDVDHAAAIDGTGGGTYSPTTAITIGGKGLVLTGAFSAEGDTNIGNTSGDTLTVVAAALFSNNVTLGSTSGDAIAIPGTSTFTGPAAFSSTATFNGATTVNDWLIVNNACTIGTSSGDDLTINSSTTFQGPVTFVDVTISGPVTFENDVTMGTNASDLIDIIGRFQLGRVMEFQNAGTGVGRVPWRLGTITDADSTLTVADGNVFQIPTDTTATRTKTLGTTNAVNGDFMVFFTGAGASFNPDFDVIIDSAVGSQDVTFDFASNSQFALYVYASGWIKAFTNT